MTVGLNEGSMVKGRVVDESKVFGWSNGKGRVTVCREWEDCGWQGCLHFDGGEVQDQELGLGYIGLEVPIRFPMGMTSKILEMKGSGRRYEFGSSEHQNTGSSFLCTLLCYAVCNLHKNCVCGTLEFVTCCKAKLLKLYLWLNLDWELLYVYFCSLSIFLFPPYSVITILLLLILVPQRVRVRVEGCIWFISNRKAMPF